jgi:hypothetical protein
MTAASGDVSYTDVGFAPKAIDFLAVIDLTKFASWGFDDGTNHRSLLLYGANYSYGSGHCIYLNDTTKGQKALIKTWDADGFTLTWTKEGSPTGTAQIYYKAYR